MSIEIHNFIICRNIRYLRKKYNLSQKALGRLIGYDPILLRAAEQEKFLPLFTDYHIQRLCDVLNVTEVQLLDIDLEQAGTVQYRREDPNRIARNYLK